MKTALDIKLQKLLLKNPELSAKFIEFKQVLSEKFGKNSNMYMQGIAVFTENALRGDAVYGIPPHYNDYWKPYRTDKILHHITIQKNVDNIKKYGLEPRDPTPRPWGGMKAIFMGDPSDPLYLKSQQAVLKHVQKKGEIPILLHIKTKNSLYKSVEPNRTFQIISVDPIAPTSIVAYLPVNI